LTNILQFVAQQIDLWFSLWHADGPSYHLVSNGSWFECTAALSSSWAAKSNFSTCPERLETHANPALRIHGIHVDLAWFQATTSGHCQYGLLVYAVEEESEHIFIEGIDGVKQVEEESR
jgi:hypothetical protein